MYKTVRHGENSLQYTILPQTEEVLSNSSLKGKGRDYSPSIHVRKSEEKFSVKWTLLTILAIIVAIGVPIHLITNGVKEYRRAQQDQLEMVTTAPIAPAGREMAKSRKKELKMLAEVLSTATPKLETSTLPTTVASTVTSTTFSAKGTTPPWTMPALRSWKSSTSSTTIPPKPTPEDDANSHVTTYSNNNRMLYGGSKKPLEKDIIILPTITAEPFTLRNLVKYYTQTFKPTGKALISNPKVFEDVLITTKMTTKFPVTADYQPSSEQSKLGDLKDTILSVDDDDEFKESLEEDEVFSLPRKTESELDPILNTDEVTVSKPADQWYGAKWPFVDPSSYFQWTSYSAGDNLLLPLLMAALTSITLVLLLALAAKRRRRTNVASAQIGKLTSDLQDANTNLLTAEVVEDAEE